MYICTQLSGNDCVAWQESAGLSLADIQALLPYVVLVLVVSFGLKLVRRSLFK